MTVRPLDKVLTWDGRLAKNVTREALALALSEHRYCDQQIRGHETCLAVADGILRRLAR